jgi:predicted ArsR family transcriptional regulator
VVCDVLTDYGYEPQIAGKTISLANCPFHTLARNQTEIVCGMNLDLIEGVLEGLGADGLRARLAPSPGRCCVTVEPAPAPG